MLDEYLTYRACCCCSIKIYITLLRLGQPPVGEFKIQNLALERSEGSKLKIKN